MQPTVGKEGKEAEKNQKSLNFNSTVAISPRPYGFFNHVTLSLYWFALSFLWGGFLSVVLPALNKPVAGPVFGVGNEDVARGILSSLGLIVAMIVQPMSGAISDRSGFKMGRRRPYMLGGTAVGLVSLAIVAFSGNWWLLLVGYMLLQLGDNTAQGAYQGLMPDIVPPDKRGKASAALGIAQLGGTLFGAVVPGVLQGTFGEINGSRLDLLLVSIVFVLSLILTVLFVKEKPFVPTEKESPLKTSLNMFKGVSHYPDFILLMLARLAFLTAPATVSLFVKSFLENDKFRFVHYKVATATSPCLDAHGNAVNTPLGQPCYVNNSLVFQAGSTLSLILGLVLISAIIGSYPASALSDRFGRKRVLYALTGVGIVGGLLMLIPASIMSAAVDHVANMSLAAQESYLDTVRPTAILMLVIFGALIGISWGGFLGVDWAFATDLIPLSEAGRFMGLSNLATAGCQALAAFIGGFIVDSGLGYRGLFLTVGVYYLISFGFLSKVREPRREKSRPALETEAIQ